MAGVTSDHYHVFLCHSSPDKPAVEELARRLKREGIEPFIDKWSLIPGDPWQEAIEQALIRSAACAVFIGPGGFGPWHREEMQVAIDHRVSGSRGGYRIIPVLLPGASQPSDDGLPRFLRRTTWVEFSRTLDDEQAFHNLVCGIRGIPPGMDSGKGIFDGECPYRGLERFDPEHARFFFGREDQIDWLLDNRLAPIACSGRARRFLAILGPSGSGKSSLALAGLVPALRAGKISGSLDWPIVILRPGDDPFENLTFELSKLNTASGPGFDLLARTRQFLQVKDFADDPRALHIFARYALDGEPADRRLVVLVDQFEEIFTLCPIERELTRRAFIDTLLHAATVVGGRALVILTLRADFLGKCASHQALAAALSDGQELVGPMTKDELRRAIEQPAYRVGCEIEPGLTELLLHDVTGQPGTLPLLQYALWELWQRRNDRRLTIAAYNAIGGVRGALEKRADEIVATLNDPEREVCRRVFLRLTQPGDGTEDTKRRAPLRDLLDSTSDAQSVEAVIGRLTIARLITITGHARTAHQGDGSDQESYVEVGHEALIRGWTQLRHWIDADRAGLRLHYQLTEAARGWKRQAGDTGFLFQGTPLAVVRKWAEAHPQELNHGEYEFLEASVKQEQERRADEAGACGIAAAYYTNFVRPILEQGKIADRRAVRGWFSRQHDDLRPLKGLILLRPESLDVTVADIELKLNHVLETRFPGGLLCHRTTPNMRINTGSSLNVMPFLVVADYMIDFPRTIFLMKSSSALQLLLNARYNNYLSDPQVFIKRFFTILTRLVSDNPTIARSGVAFHVGMAEEIPNIIETGLSDTFTKYHNV